MSEISAREITMKKAIIEPKARMEQPVVTPVKAESQMIRDVPDNDRVTSIELPVQNVVGRKTKLTKFIANMA